MSDDSDDDLFENVGLSFSSRNKKRKADQKREALMNILDCGVEEDFERRQRLGRLTHILEDNTNAVEQAEENLESARKKKLEIKDEHLGVSEQQKAMQSAKEISGFDRLGTRHGVIKLVPRESLPDLHHILQNVENKQLKKRLQAAIDIGMLPAVLEHGKLARKFDLSAELVCWLWRSAIDYESEYREGAFVTLKDLFSLEIRMDISLNDMITQWKDWFQDRDTSTTPKLAERDRNDCLVDIHNWLTLWATLIENATNVNNVEEDSVADVLVALSQVPVDALFYGHNHNELASSWCRAISLLLRALRAKLGDLEWGKWIVCTSNCIIDTGIDLAPEGSEDADDTDCLLSRALVVKAFGSSDIEFGTALALVALGRFVGISDWDNEVPKLLQDEDNVLQGWLLSKYKDAGSARPWKLLTCTYCAFLVVENKGEEIKLDPPRLLACIKLIQDCAAACLLGFANNDDGSACSVDFTKWLTLLDEQVFKLNKFVSRFSAEAHFQRSEVNLLFLKSWINAQKSFATCSASIQVQSSMVDWVLNMDRTVKTEE